jgi:O-phospho-L-seryl-tRNASec:L-selenocysteinyl-tRNA synthase
VSDELVRPPRQDEDDVAYRTSVSRDVSSSGAMLFQRCVSGTRIVPRGTVQRMGGMEFCGFGSSHDAYPHAYLTAACAIGLTASEGDDFFTRLDQTLHEFQKRQRRRA